MNDINFAAFNWADYLIVGIIVLSLLISLIRGFIREALSLATWVVALWVAYKFTSYFASSLTNYIQSASIRYALVFVGIFLAVLIVGALVSFVISLFLNRTGLSGIDRILGMIFGFARGVLLVGILLLLANMTHMEKNPWWVQSQLIPKFQGLADWLKDVLPDEIREFNAKVKPNGDNDQPAEGIPAKKPATKSQ